MYKKPNIRIIIDFLNFFYEIKNKHYELIDSSLLMAVERLEKSIKGNKYDHKSYIDLCRTIDRLFEKSRKTLKLPARKLSYRIYNDQFSDGIIFSIISIKDDIIGLIPLFALGALFIVLTKIFNFLTNLLMQL